MKHRILTALFAVVLITTACGGGRTNEKALLAESPAATSAAISSTSPSQEVTEQAPSPSVATEPTADSIVAALQAAGLPIGDVKIYTAEDDPNALLGRPGQYIGKAAFHDTRIGEDVAGPFDVQRGGSVELFASAGDAERRTAYVLAATQAIAPLTEYDYQHGKILLRLSHQLTPDQAKQYEAALNASSDEG